MCMLAVVTVLLPLLVHAENIFQESQGPVPPWIAYVTGVVLVVIVLYYFCRKSGFDESLQQPLLGGYMIVLYLSIFMGYYMISLIDHRCVPTCRQYTDDGQPLTRQDVRESYVGYSYISFNSCSSFVPFE